MKNYVIIFVLAMIFLSSCTGCSDSDWAEVTIPSEEKLVFVVIDESDPYYSKAIAVPLDDKFSDTLFVMNYNQIRQICHFKLSNPDMDIRLEYKRDLNDNYRKAAAIFVRLVE